MSIKTHQCEALAMSTKSFQPSSIKPSYLFAYLSLYFVFILSLRLAGKTIGTSAKEFNIFLSNYGMKIGGKKCKQRCRYNHTDSQTHRNSESKQKMNHELLLIVLKLCKLLGYYLISNSELEVNEYIVIAIFMTGRTVHKYQQYYIYICIYIFLFDQF